MEIDLRANMGTRRLLERTQTKVDSEGNVSHSEERTSIVRERREKFMLLYVENYNHLIGLQRRTQEILAIVLARKVTYGTNEVLLDSVFRAEMAKELNTTKQTVHNSIAELVTRKVLQRQKLPGGWRYHLNPYLFGTGEWNSIKQMRQQFTLDYDFHNYKATKTLTTVTQYDNDDINNKNIQVIALDEYKDDCLHIRNVLLSESEMPQDIGECNETMEQQSNQNMAMRQINHDEKSDTKEVILQEIEENKSPPPIIELEPKAPKPTQPTRESQTIAEQIEYLKLKNKSMELQMQLAQLQLEEKKVDLELLKMKIQAATLHKDTP